MHGLLGTTVAVAVYDGLSSFRAPSRPAPPQRYDVYPAPLKIVSGTYQTSSFRFAVRLQPYPAPACLPEIFLPYLALHSALEVPAGVYTRTS